MSFCTHSTYSTFIIFVICPHTHEPRRVHKCTSKPLGTWHCIDTQVARRAVMCTDHALFASCARARVIGDAGVLRMRKRAHTQSRHGPRLDLKSCTVQVVDFGGVRRVSASRHLIGVGCCDSERVDPRRVRGQSEAGRRGDVGKRAWGEREGEEGTECDRQVGDAGLLSLSLSRSLSLSATQGYERTRRATTCRVGKKKRNPESGEGSWQDDRKKRKRHLGSGHSVRAL